MLPFFPLNLIVFPGEQLNLHIFEPRYKQLVNDCLDGNSTFGIPVYLDDQLKEYGTEVKIIEVVNRYQDGRMDLRTQGQRVFKINSFLNPMINKLHAGGSVEFIGQLDDANALEKLMLVEAIQQLYEILKMEFYLNFDTPLLSYHVAHKIGLSQQQEYELLQLPRESLRITFLMEHLNHSIPIVREMERTKEIIRMNGHFRHLDPLKF